MTIEETQNEPKKDWKQLFYKIFPLTLIALVILVIIIILIFGMNIVLILLLIFLSVILVGALFSDEVIEALKDLFSKR